MTPKGYSVKIGRWSNQGHATFAEAVEQIADAHAEGETWGVTVHDGRSYRPLNDNEAGKLIAAVTKEIA
jgi:hypothetical protein